jgi:hypothetical protein
LRLPRFPLRFRLMDLLRPASRKPQGTLSLFSLLLLLLSSLIHNFASASRCASFCMLASHGASRWCFLSSTLHSSDIRHPTRDTRHPHTPTSLSLCPPASILGFRSSSFSRSLVRAFIRLFLSPPRVPRVSLVLVSVSLFSSFASDKKKKPLSGAGEMSRSPCVLCCAVWIGQLQTPPTPILLQSLLD